MVVKGVCVMKKIVIRTLIFAVFALTLIGLIDTGATTAHAMGYIPGFHHGNPTGGGGGTSPTQSVPEPVTLVFLGAGIAGIGIYSIIRKRIK